MQPERTVAPPTVQLLLAGDGSAGQLGNGNFDSFSTPVAAAKEHTFRMLTAGWRHVCGIGEAGDAWCWG